MLTLVQVTVSGVIDNLNATFQECNIRGTFDCLESAIRQNKDQFQYFRAKMQQFEQQGYNTKELFRDYKTPVLHCAVAAGFVEMVEKLVDLGASECTFYNLSSYCVPYSQSFFLPVNQMYIMFQRAIVINFFTVTPCLH